jgi:hypothetical protein
MNEYQLTVEAKEDLRNFLGEVRCFGKDKYYCDFHGVTIDGDNAHEHLRRDFTSAQDMVDLTKRILEKDLWPLFEQCMFFTWCGGSVPETKELFYAMLISNPKRFCYIVWQSGVWK